MTLPYDLAPAMFVVMALAALLIGIAKLSVGGFASVAMAVFALVIPAKQSTAAVLLLLMLGDFMAVATYRRDANWSLIRGIMPAIIPGIALGALFMKLVNDDVMKRSIGVMLLASVALQWWMLRRQRRVRAEEDDLQGSKMVAWGSGIATGFTTMTANAAGAVMALYLVVSRVNMRAFIGTNAWFFLLVNLVKAPFSAALGLFPPETWRLTLYLAPAVIIGALIGRWIVTRINQKVFDMAVLIASALAALALLIF